MLSTLVQSAISGKSIQKMCLSWLAVFFTCFVCFLLSQVMAEPLRLAPSGQVSNAGFLSLALTDNEPKTTHFIAVGDTGSGNANQQAVATAMKVRYATNPYQFVLHLGDIIYPVGNVDKDGERLYMSFYRYWYEDFKVPVWVALGNHDMLYKQGKPALKFYGIPSYYYKNTVGNVELFTLNTNRFDANQQAWLKSGLLASKAKWKVVYGHHPIGTSGEHGREALVLNLRKTLLPTLAEGKADAYLAGHDHDYERFAPTAESPLLTLVSGGGGAYLRNQSELKAGSVKFIKAHHYLEGLADDKTLRFQALDVNNAPIDCVILKKTAVKLSFASSAWKTCDQVVVPFVTTGAVK
jgi:Calcineurin-like phosphoesterase